MDKNKSHLIEVLAKKGLAFCIIHSTSEATESKQSVIENIQGVFDEILKYAEPTNKEVATYIFFCISITNLFELAQIITGDEIIDPSCPGAQSLWKSS